LYGGDRDSGRATTVGGLLPFERHPEVIAFWVGPDGSLPEDSDINILVEFDRRRRIGYLKMAALERELAALIRRKVDLRTPDELSPYFRDEVLRCAVVQYEQR